MLTVLWMIQVEMLFKIALEEAFALPSSLSDNSPIGFSPADASPEEDLNTNLLDIHGHRLRQMDENGVELMILSLNAPGCQGLFNQAAAEALSASANDCLEDQVMKHPGRFAAFAALSMHDPKQAADELIRCMRARRGFVGALLNDFQSSGRTETQCCSMIIHDTMFSGKWRPS